MAGVVADERLVEDEVRLREARVQIAHLPLVGVFAERELAVLGGGEIFCGPLQFLDLGSRGRRRSAARLGSWYRPHPDVALGARVGTSRPQALEGIHDEGQRLPLDLDLLDRLARRHLVHCRHGQNGVADVERLVRQAPLTERARDDAFAEVGAFDDRRQIVDGQDRLHAGHRGGRARVHSFDPGVRHRAQE
jgi:hypothetical protein